MRRYCVANNIGELAGHDMDLDKAEQCLEAMLEEDPNAGWEIIEQD